MRRPVEEQEAVALWHLLPGAGMGETFWGKRKMFCGGLAHLKSALATYLAEHFKTKFSEHIRPCAPGQPYLAITYGTLPGPLAVGRWPLASTLAVMLTRSQAFYLASKEAPQNPQVKATRKTGLANCRVLSSKTPDDVLVFLRDLNNRFHEGGRISFLEQVEEVQHVEDAGALAQLSVTVRLSVSGVLLHLAWTAYMERRGFTNRNVENVRDEFGRWLQSSEYKEKYGPESYKFAKALKNKLRHFRIFESWVDFFSREADFLSPDMSKPEVIVRNMNTFGACIEMFSGSYAPEELGYVLMELSKFCAAPLYVFNRGSESQLMAQAQEKLNCIVAGAIFVRKIAPGKPEPSEAASKKRARKNAAAADGEEEQAADLEADIVMPMTGGLQPRLIIASAISLALRFAFGNGITINNKFMKDWSKVRPMLQSLARGAIAQESSSLPGGGVDDIFAKLLRESQAQELAAASGRAAAAGTASSDGCSKPSNKGRQPTASDDAGQPSFADIYSLCDVKPDAAAADPALAATAVSGSGKMRVIDIMHIQRQIENFFLAKADTKGTLTVLAVDKLFNQHESGALERMLHPDAASERRLHVCGSVTTEASWKNFKVADAVFPNGLVISYYMHGDGWNKQTSLLPHPFWMMKNGFEAQKACCLSSTETISKTFQDTCLGPGTPGPTRKDRNVSPAVWLFDIFIHCQINMTWPHSRPCCGEPPSAHKRRSGPPEGGGWGPGWGGPVGVWRVPLPAVQGKAPT
ncbi:unnamed protein product [Effrenium voratum]|nr:unnamed protein product [Effrenium voratum]